MVARQSKVSFSRGSSRPRDRTQVSHIAGRCFNCGSTREALKYKNTVSENLLQRHRTLDLSTNIKDFKGGKEARLKEEGGRRERGGLTDVSCHLQMPRCYETFRWASREGRTGTRPYQKSEPEFGSVSNPQLRLRAHRPDSCVQDRGTRKTGRDRKGQGEEGEREGERGQ